MKTNKGFTLIELLVVIGIIAILAAIVIVSINPAKRFQDARNSQRQANVESILNAMQQAIVDNKGIIPTACGTLPTGTDITDAEPISDADVDLAEADCLLEYLAVLPYDPSATGAKWEDEGDYDTGYLILLNGTTQQITIFAPESEDDGFDPDGDGTENIISVTR
jgi:prepilin-type N-terminal cleavage/methylation domain-containing protein